MMGSLFFDPLASPPSVPAAMCGSAAIQAGVQRSAGATDEPSRRSTGPVTDEQDLRAASLRKVSRDLDRLLRERTS